MTAYKVLFFSHDAKLAGAEIVLSHFVSALDRKRFDPLVIVPQRGPLEAVLTRHNVPCVYVPFFTTMVKSLTDPVILNQMVTIKEAIQTIAPDLIVINTVTIPHVIVAALTTNIPILVHIHEFIDKKQFELLPATTRLFEEIWLQFPETLLADSGWGARCYKTLLGRDIPVIPNFVRLPQRWQGGTAEPSTVPNIVMFASPDDQNKRADLFIAAANAIRLKYPDLKFHCTLIGNGSQEAIHRLHQQIAGSHLEDVVSIQPRVEDVGTIYQSSDIVFVGSDVESFSMLVIEAGSYFRPVVSTRCGGPDELIVDGETGFLVDIGDSDTAAERLAFLLQHPDQARQMGEAGRLRVEQFYSRDSVMPLYENLLENTILNRSQNAIQRRIGNPIARYFMGLA